MFFISLELHIAKIVSGLLVVRIQFNITIVKIILLKIHILIL